MIEQSTAVAGLFFTNCILSAWVLGVAAVGAARGKRRDEEYTKQRAAFAKALEDAGRRTVCWQCQADLAPGSSAKVIARPSGGNALRCPKCERAAKRAREEVHGPTITFNDCAARGTIGDFELATYKPFRAKRTRKSKSSKRATRRGRAA